MEMETIIAELDSLLELLKQAQKEYLMSVVAYSEVKSKLWLETDFPEVLGKGRPTVDEKKAYVTLNSLTHKRARDEAYYEVQYIKSKMDVCYAKLEILGKDE